MIIYNINISIIIILMISIIIGISLQNILVSDTNEMKWISRYNLDNILLIYITFILNNIILILAIISLMINNISNNNNKILLIHFILILILTIYICNNNNNNIISIILLIIFIDIISVINIIIINSGEGIWYYFLYQSLMTILIWWLLILDFSNLIHLIYYYKLGTGIGGYYIPSLYSSIINNNSYLLIYIGICNIILMYNPIFLLNLILDNSYIFLLTNFLFIILILIVWIINGYMFVNIWLYAISFSTIILSNIYYIFPSLSLISYNLYYYCYYFTLTSIIIWFIFLISFSFISQNTSLSGIQGYNIKYLN